MLYTLTIGLSAFLLFLVQPLVSKIILPWFGGGASIWITSLVFFQTMLLAGYGGTHLLVRLLGLRRHLVFTAGLLIVSVAFLPVHVDVTLGRELPPSPSLLLILLASVGIPYFLLATTSPTLQYWIANDRRTTHRNPYIEYGFSNLGSMLGLLAYPFALELYFDTTSQSWFWTGLYGVYGLLLATTIGMFWPEIAAAPSERPLSDLSGALHLRWLFLAMIPSALLLVTTHYLTIDVVNLPLLWVAPLCTYLLTFILCFLKPGLAAPTPWRTAAGAFTILGLVIANYGAFEFGFGTKIFWALACLFVVGMICHGDLERAKPHKRDLTAFYLQVSAGGAAGSILIGIIAPLVFDTTFEFYLVLIVALYYVSELATAAVEDRHPAVARRRPRIDHDGFCRQRNDTDRQYDSYRAVLFQHLCCPCVE
ncbi:MAG: hypothetical protein U5O39_08315 [Gammaproteobacteria bacterium]|nr:hypothetical protein [Gammaproteobacteria bacterium]